MSRSSEKFVLPVNLEDFNSQCCLPYNLKIEDVHSAMNDFCQFLDFINSQLHSKGMPIFESMLMPANFSSIVGEYMNATIPQYTTSLVKNRYHNGHPDLILKDHFPNDAAQHSHEGIEVKASRYEKSWQGHNPESIWLLVFVFDSSRPTDGSNIRPFEFKLVCGAKLEESDWKFSGRREGSRRTITASVTNSGYQKMLKNWLYISPSYRSQMRWTSPSTLHFT